MNLNWPTSIITKINVPLNAINLVKKFFSCGVIHIKVTFLHATKLSSSLFFSPLFSSLLSFLLSSSLFSLTLFFSLFFFSPSSSTLLHVRKLPLWMTPQLKIFFTRFMTFNGTLILVIEVAYIIIILFVFFSNF